MRGRGARRLPPGRRGRRLPTVRSVSAFRRSRRTTGSGTTSRATTACTSSRATPSSPSARWRRRSGRRRCLPRKDRPAAFASAACRERRRWNCGGPRPVVPSTPTSPKPSSSKARRGASTGAAPARRSSPARRSAASPRPRGSGGSRPATGCGSSTRRHIGCSFSRAARSPRCAWSARYRRVRRTCQSAPAGSTASPWPGATRPDSGVSTPSGGTRFTAATPATTSSRRPSRWGTRSRRSGSWS